MDYILTYYLLSQAFDYHVNQYAISKRVFLLIRKISQQPNIRAANITL